MPRFLLAAALVATVLLACACGAGEGDQQDEDVSKAAPGAGDTPSAAETPGAGAVPGSRLAVLVDMDPSVPGVQSEREVTLESGPILVDVVVENPPRAIGPFQLSLRYDDTILIAPDVEDPGPGVNGNPDANEDSLDGGSGSLDCSTLGVAPPAGDADPESGPGKGLATLACTNIRGPYVLDSTGTLATITFEPVAKGTSSLEFQGAAPLYGVLLGDRDAVELGSCGPTLRVEMTCHGGTIEVVEGQ